MTNSVVVSVRYSVDIDTFYSLNGPTAFIDRVAAVLGINPASIRIVQLQSGSSIILGFIESSYQLDNSGNSTAAHAELSSMIDTLYESAANGSLSILNSTLLDASFRLSLIPPSNPKVTTLKTVISSTTLPLIIIAIVIGLMLLIIAGYIAYKRHQKNKSQKIDVLSRKVEVIPKKRFSFKKNAHRRSTAYMCTELPLALPSTSRNEHYISQIGSISVLDSKQTPRVFEQGLPVEKRKYVPIS